MRRGMRRYRKNFTRPFAIRGCNDWRLQANKIQITEEASEEEIALGSEPGKQSVKRGSQSQMWDVAKIFGTMIFFLDRVGLR